MCIRDSRTGYAYDAMDRVTSVSKAVPSLPVTVSNSYTYEHDLSLIHIFAALAGHGFQQHHGMLLRRKQPVQGLGNPRNPHLDTLAYMAARMKIICLLYTSRCV